MKKQSGFTLIELMIVIAIIAILSAIAIPAYNSYITEANITRVDTAYQEGISALKAEMAKRQSVIARGQDYTELAVSDIIDLLNPDGKFAPGDATNIFATTAVDVDGVIGVSTNSATDSTLQYILTRPSYKSADGGFTTQEVMTVTTDSRAST